MPRKSIIFLDKIYRTQGEFETFVKNLIYNEIGVCNDIKNEYPFQYGLLIRILERHPDFILKTKNMCNIQIIEDKLNRNALKIMIINTDKSKIDISWKCAITGKNKSDKSSLMSAMRSSIDDQIHQFRKDNELKCVFCFRTDNLQVDHIIHFDEIVFNFMNVIKDKKINIPNEFIETDDNTHRKCFLEIDNNFKNEWINYHYINSSLRVLCKTCNLTRTKSKNKI